MAVVASVVIGLLLTLAWGRLVFSDELFDKFGKVALLIPKFLWKILWAPVWFVIGPVFRAIGRVAGMVADKHPDGVEYALAAGLFFTMWVIFAAVVYSLIHS